MRKIRLLRALVLAFAVLQILYFALAWLAPDTGQIGPVKITFFPKALAAHDTALLPAAQRWTGALCSLPSLLMMCFALWRLDALLRAFAAGRTFALATIGHLKAFSAATLAALALSIIEPATRALVWRHLLGDRTAAVSMGVSSEELVVMLVCALFYVIAAMMHEGRRLAEENEGFV